MTIKLTAILVAAGLAASAFGAQAASLPIGSRAGLAEAPIVDVQMRSERRMMRHHRMKRHMMMRHKMHQRRMMHRRMRNM